MILYINCCPRSCSRTARLAQTLLGKPGNYEEINPEKEGLLPLNEERLKYRTELISKGDYSDDIFRYAKQFAEADTIVIAAPFWDLSFPAELKTYIENIYVTGIVSRYSKDGKPEGLCRAKTLYYVTTAGGIYDGRYSFEYIKDLAENYFGIDEAVLIKAEMLDIEGNDPESILAESMEHCAAINTKYISLSERFMDTPDIRNARQLGGYRGDGGRKVRNGLLFRTARLDKISDETAKKLSEKYSIKCVIDFRFGYERELYPDPEIPGAENINISLFEMDMNDPKNIEMMKKVTAAGSDEMQKLIEYAKTGQLSDLYSDILKSGQSHKGFAQFFRILLDNKDGAVLWHCTYGKDRTGVAAALVLYALGVDEDIIMQDFLLTNEVYRNNIAYLQGELKKRGCDDSVINEAQAMAGVKGEYLTAAFEAVKTEYGSIQDYIKNQLGVSDEEITKLRDMYLE